MKLWLLFLEGGKTLRVGAYSYLEAINMMRISTHQVYKYKYVDMDEYLKNEKHYQDGGE